MTERGRRAVVGSVGAASLAALAGCGSLGGGQGSDAEPVDRTGQSSVDVAVGAGNGFAFEPRHVVVDVGTTVVWEWTGEGGGHNVVTEDDTLDSALVDEAGHTYEHDFAEPGVYEYVCTPHQTRGMRGVVEVVE